MSILIKGMEMPRNCLECELYGAMYSSGCDVASLGIPKRYNYDPHTRPDWCPLVELPEKHGRLIDADKIIKDMNEMKVKGEAFVTAVEYVKIIVGEAPTVIEAEGE